MSAVFFSFHYARDNARVQQVMNMGAIEGHNIVSGQKWEDVKRGGSAGIERWIATQMNGKSAVVVLVGRETASRDWVLYEIQKAWNDRIPLLGINIHGLRDLDRRTDAPGANPFARVKDGLGRPLSSKIAVHDPVGTNSQAKYNYIKNNINGWIRSGVRRA
jgi:hypothetical protein